MLCIKFHDIVKNEFFDFAAGDIFSVIHIILSTVCVF
jgi:hypothetical protein